VTQYGHVNLQTKAEIEHNKRQETLSAFLGAMADFDRAGRAVVAALEGLDPETLREWRSRPGKLAKLQAWCKSIELAAEKLRDINTTGNA
jgi:phosphoserine phosphatase